MEAHTPAVPSNPAAREPRVLDLTRRAAAQLGLQVCILDPEYGHLVQLTDGQRAVTLLGGRSPLNDAVAARICEDKFYTALVLQRFGIRVPEAVRCLKPGHFELVDYRDRAGKGPGTAFVRSHGYPVVVKPNRLSHGRHIYVVNTAAELHRAIERVWEHDYIALVQEPVLGQDVRLDYLDGSFLAGYLRVPGEAPAGARESDADAGHPEIEILNLNRGARAHYITHPPRDWTTFCLQVGDVLGLRHFGVDVRAPSWEAGPAGATVIEVNASPLLVQIDALGHSEQAVAAQARVLKAIWERPA